MGKKRKLQHVDKKSARTRIISIVLLAVCLVVGVFWVYQQYVAYPLAMIQQVLANPGSFAGRRLAVKGVLVKNVGARWGGTYSLYASDMEITRDTPHIELSIPDVSEHLIGYTFDGSTFQRQSSCPVVAVEGVLRDRGLVADAARYFVEVSSITTS